MDDKQHITILPECLEKFGDLNISITRVIGNVEYIRNQIDNGLKSQTAEMHDLILSLKPVIEHHNNIIKRIEDIGWWISRSLFVVMIGVVIWAIKHGWNP